MKVLQLGKFYPIRGGVEKVMWDLTRGLGERGIDCDMLCATRRNDGIDAEHLPLFRKEGKTGICKSMRTRAYSWCAPGSRPRRP